VFFTLKRAFYEQKTVIGKRFINKMQEDSLVSPQNTTGFYLIPYAHAANVNLTGFFFSTLYPAHPVNPV